MRLREFLLKDLNVNEEDGEKAYVAVKKGEMPTPDEPRFTEAEAQERARTFNERLGKEEYEVVKA